MSPQTKKLLRRKMAQAYNQQMKTVEIMLFMRDTFEEWHPDYAEFLDTIAQNAFMTCKFIKNVSTKAWGYFPEDIDTWLK